MSHPLVKNKRFWQRWEQELEHLRSTDTLEYLRSTDALAYLRYTDTLEQDLAEDWEETAFLSLSILSFQTVLVL